MTWVAAVQMASGPNVSANLGEAERLIAQAVDGGAKLVVLPENFAHMSTGDGDWRAVRETDGRGRIQDFLAAQAARHGVWLVGGTIPLESPKTDRYRAACLVYDDSGQRVALQRLVAGRFDVPFDGRSSIVLHRAHESQLQRRTQLLERRALRRGQRGMRRQPQRDERSGQGSSVHDSVSIGQNP